MVELVDLLTRLGVLRPLLNLFAEHRGFIDIDSGVVDSIKDIQNEVRHTSQFQLVTAPEKAEIVIDTEKVTAGDAAQQILSYLEQRGYLTA